MAQTRKSYTAEFKLQAVRMVTDQHLAVAEVARRPSPARRGPARWASAKRPSTGPNRQRKAIPFLRLRPALGVTTHEK